MPNLKSSKKDLRQSIARHTRNLSLKRELRTFIRKVREACAAGNLAAAQEIYPTCCQKLDRAASKNLIHRNTASRLKSRLCARIKAVEKAA